MRRCAHSAGRRVARRALLEEARPLEPLEHALGGHDERDLGRAALAVPQPPREHRVDRRAQVLLDREHHGHRLGERRHADPLAGVERRPLLRDRLEPEDEPLGPVLRDEVLGALGRGGLRGRAVVSGGGGIARILPGASARASRTGTGGRLPRRGSRLVPA